MNVEYRFVSALLSANKAEQDTFWANHPPLGVFRLHQNELAWIYLHREQHGRFPTRALFADRYDAKLPKSAEILTEALYPVLVNASYSEIKRVVEQVGVAFEEKKDPIQIVEQFKNEAAKISAYSTAFLDENLADPNVAFARYLSSINDGTTGKLSTPWGNLNKIIGGDIRAGEVLTIVARPYLGKSWIACALADHAAKSQIPTLFVSKEMPVGQVSDRLTSLRFALPYLALRNRELDLIDRVRWKLGVLRKKRYPLLVSGEETFKGTSLADVYSKTQKVRPSLLIVDGAYLLSVEGIPASKEREKFAAISAAAKRMAKTLNLSVVLVLQMNREADHLDPKTGQSVSRGGLSTIYGADAWGQDADYVIEVRGAAGEKHRELAVLKARDAGIGSALINFNLDSYPNFSPKQVTASDLKLVMKPL